jgi:subtilisin family serine protease
MNLKLSSLLAIVTLTIILGGTLLLPAATPPAQPAYVEPALWAANHAAVPVIVTAWPGYNPAGLIQLVGGQVTSNLWLIDAVAATLPANRLPVLAAAPGVRSIVSDKAVKAAQDPLWDGWAASYNVTVPWNGAPDATPTNNPKIWNLLNPVPVDVGADVLHRDYNITGSGVTVAVLDSGVYFSPAIKNAFGAHLANKFKGQVDFAGVGVCPIIPPECNQFTSDCLEVMDSAPVVDMPGYCLADYTTTYDGYGHGSHVAGAIWNNITDQTTGVYAGIAPGANILSVRVLNAAGAGAYTDVIEGIQYVVANKSAFNIRVLNISLSATATTPYFEDTTTRGQLAGW